MTQPRLSEADPEESARMVTPLISIRGLNRTYGTGTTTTALRDASLDVYEGEFVAIVGPSGAGKSTLLNLLGLLDQPTSGSYILDGVDVLQLKHRQIDRLRSHTFGFIFQSSHVLSHEPASLNASLGLRVQGTPFKERRARVQDVLQQFGLSHRADIEGRLLSGGERQRLAIARAVASDPRIILADEPTGNLDSQNTTLVISDLKRLASSGVTVLVITHDERVASAADRSVSLIDGVLDGTSGSQRILGDEDPVASAAVILHPRPKPLIGSILDTLVDALNTLSSRPFRTILLLVAFLLGAGGLVAAAGLSSTTAVQVSERLNQAALDEVRFSDLRLPRSSFASQEDVLERKSIVGILHGVRHVGVTSVVSPADAAITRFKPISGERIETFTGPVEVADADYLTLQEAVVQPSSGIALLDAPNQIPTAVIGREAASDLGIGEPGPNVLIWVHGNPVPVVGILKSSGRDTAAEAKVYLNPAASSLIPNIDTVFVARTDPGLPAPLSDAIPQALSADAPASIEVQTVADLRNLKRGVGSDLSSLVAIISAVLLGLACMTAATAMYLSVQARTAEIALRRALGTSRGEIASMFLLEGVLVGLAGGIAGAVFGLIAVIGVALVQGWSPVLSAGLPILGILSGGGTGAIAAVYPALMAARADPAQALRS